VSRRVVVLGDVGELPDYAFGPTSLGWWAVFGFMLIEGAGFVLAIGAYFFLLPFEQHWPPAASPDLLWGTLTTALGIASVVPNVWVDRRAHECKLQPVQRGLVLMTTIGVAMIALRAFELGALNVRWDQNAYGSIVWALMLLHTVHLVTDVYDSAVLMVMSYTKEMTGRRFSDVSDNALYWHFIVGSWIVIYLVVYGVPRWV
jgi:cytochrome c oxidase subunit III